MYRRKERYEKECIGERKGMRKNVQEKGKVCERMYRRKERYEKECIGERKGMRKNVQEKGKV